MKLHTAYFEDGSIIEQVASQLAFKRTVSNWRRLTGAGRVFFNSDAWLSWAGYCISVN